MVFPNYIGLFLHLKVLSDDKKRALYDQYGEAGVKSGVGGPAGAYTVIYLAF